MQKIYRVIISIILLFSFLNVVAMLILNFMRAIHAYSHLFDSENTRPGLEIMEVVDGLLLVLLLLIMNIGFMKLFLPESKWARSLDLPWLKINSFSQLKMLLIETILTTLVIVFATTVIKEDGKLNWNDIVLPSAIFLFALTIKSVKEEGH
jgi:uncharacterized membrane protein YqhA